MNYAQVYNDSAHFQYGTGAFRKQLTSFEIIADGTLLLPSTTFNNAFVLKKETYLKNPSTNAETDHYLNYYFYDSLTSQPVLEISYFSVFGGALGNKSVKSSDVTIGILEVNNFEEIKLYPNPFTNEIFISGNSCENIKIYDVQMKQINFVSTTNPNGIKISFNYLDQGVYFVSLSQNNIQYVFKAIKM